MRQFITFSFASISLALAGCANVVPNFDIPIDQYGQPTIRSITDRVTCELAGLLRAGSVTGRILRDEDFEIALQLNLTVNDTGALNPVMTFPQAIPSFGIGGTLSQSREQNFGMRLYYSMRQIQNEADFLNAKGFDLAKCRQTDTNLAGELGLRRTVQIALTAQHGALDLGLDKDGVFGGYVSFVVTKSLNGGPTFVLRNFNGPGNNLANISEVNTDKLAFAFARGPNAGKPFKRTESRIDAIQRGLARSRADHFIDQLNLNQLTNQLGGLRVVP